MTSHAIPFTPASTGAGTAPHPIGVGLKAQHYRDVLRTLPPVSFFEVHAENHMVDGGPHKNYLQEICRHYPLSVHGVGMSLGSADGLCDRHLKKFSKLVDDFRPWLVSEHLAWSVGDGHYLNDLLPLPLNKESLEVVSANIMRLQDTISRQILVENPSSYMAFTGTTIPEVEFLSALVDQTGCGLLVDVNNIFVSCKNLGGDPFAYVDQVPVAAVSEVHLAGHLLKTVDGHDLRIDDHGSPVCDEVWDLYDALIVRTGSKPSLLEWDTNIPDFAVLVDEALKARERMQTLDRRRGEVAYV